MDPKPQSLKNRVALITGGGSGIGRAIARRFATEGAAVAVADLRPEAARSTVEEIEENGGQALAIKADVSLEDAVLRMQNLVVERWNRVDVLVNNAGLAAGDDILTYDEATWNLNFDVVLKGAFLCSKAVLPGMLDQGRGAIVNIASVNGLTALGQEAYSAAKAGLINFTQNLAIRYGSRGIRANVICPGTIRTPIWQTRLDQDPQVFERLARWYPLNRVGEPEDVANAARFLASDEAAWITGITLNVDGGLMAGRYHMGRELEGETSE